MWKMNNDKVYIDKIGLKKINKNKFIYMEKKNFLIIFGIYLWGT